MTNNSVTKPPRDTRRRQRIAYRVGALVSLGAVAVLALPVATTLHEPGPRNTGHEKLDCNACHQQERGTLRQRAQARVQYLLGHRQQSVEIGFRPVGNADCLACHTRPNDPHSVYRFLEPRFLEVRAKSAPQLCVTCHREHRGIRVTSGAQSCADCHAKINLKKDPLDVPHVTLAAQARWDTCLRCHDYHDNHQLAVPRNFGAAWSRGVVDDYLHGAAAPYPNKATVRAKTTREDSHEI